jgi:uncharacterized protein YndB with AHSA1/START domain
MTTRRNPEHRGRTITASIRTTATPERLWEAWADPERLAHWFPDRAEGRAEVGATQTWYFDRFKYALPYEVFSAVPGEHLVLTGEPPGRPRFFLEIDLRREGGSTVLTLTNSGFLDQEGWDEEYEGIVSGWQLSLAVLKEYAERYDGRPRTQFFAMRPGAFEYAELRPLFREPAALARWLTSSGGIGAPGDHYELTLMDGTIVDGEILAVTAWEVLVSWRAIQGVLALKAFSMGPGRRALCIHGSGWNLAPARAAALEADFGAALDRLAALLESSQTPA